MSIKVKTYEYDVKNDVGSIVGYASTWIREPEFRSCGAISLRT